MFLSATEAITPRPLQTLSHGPHRIRRQVVPSWGASQHRRSLLGLGSAFHYRALSSSGCPWHLPSCAHTDHRTHRLEHPKLTQHRQELTCIFTILV